jgi:TolB-like protein
MMDDNPSPAESGDRLDSWKAIANYLGKSVRTAKRWEAEEGLPVHRHMHQRQGTVHASKREIDRWRRRRDLAPVVRTPAVSDERPGLMVLPFEHLGPDSQHAWLASGIADALIDQLAGIDELRVLSRTSTRILVERDGPSRQALRALGQQHAIGYIVEGTTRADATDLQVSIRLIDTRQDAVVGSERFNGRLDEALAIQARVARHVARNMAKVLGESFSPDEAPADGPATTAEWQCLVLARQDAISWRRSGLQAAIQRLENGLEALGRRPMLLAALGRTWLQVRESASELGPGPLRRARACADELADREIRHPARIQLDGWIRYADGNIPGAIRALQRADAVQPDDPETLGLLANCLLISDRGEEAQPLIERLGRIDPLTPITACLPGWKLLLEGDFDAAIPHYERMRELDPHNPMAVAFVVQVLALAGRRDALAGIFDEAPFETSDAVALDPVTRIARFLAAAVIGDAHARDWLDGSIDELGHASDVLPRLLAGGFAALGDTEQALYWVDQAIERGFAHIPFLAERDPLLARLRGTPAFVERLDRLQARKSVGLGVD